MPTNADTQKQKEFKTVSWSSPASQGQCHRTKSDQMCVFFFSSSAWKLNVRGDAKHAINFKWPKIGGNCLGLAARTHKKMYRWTLPNALSALLS